MTRTPLGAEPRRMRHGTAPDLVCYPPLAMHPTPPSNPLRAYGDREGDGMLQMSFVLQVPPSARAREAAKRFAELHGLKEPLVATMEECAEGYSYFVVYGHSRHAIDVAEIEVPEIRSEALTRDEIEKRIA